jgi:hypothetical protein
LNSRINIGQYVIYENNEYQQYIQPECLVGDSERILGIKDSFLKNKPKYKLKLWQE